MRPGTSSLYCQRAGPFVQEVWHVRSLKLSEVDGCGSVDGLRETLNTFNDYCWLVLRVNLTTSQTLTSGVLAPKVFTQNVISIFKSRRRELRNRIPWQLTSVLKNLFF